MPLVAIGMMDATTPVCFLVVHESFLGRVMFEAFSVKASDAEGSPSADPCLHHSFLIWEQLHFEVQAEFCLGFRAQIQVRDTKQFVQMYVKNKSVYSHATVKRNRLEKHSLWIQKERPCR